jgi:hypothetical protein
MLNPAYAIARAAEMISNEESRIPPPPDLDIEAHAASVLLSGALSSDGTTFDIKVILDPGALIDGDAAAQFGEDCAVVTVATVPASLPSGSGNERLAGLLLIAARAYAAEWSRVAAEPHFTADAAERYIATAAISARARAAIAAARIRLAH